MTAANVLLVFGLVVVVGIPIFFMFFNPMPPQENDDSIEVDDIEVDGGRINICGAKVGGTIRVNGQVINTDNQIQAGGQIIINSEKMAQDENGNLVIETDGQPVKLDNVQVDGSLTLIVRK